MKLLMFISMKGLHKEVICFIVRWYLLPEIFDVSLLWRYLLKDIIDFHSPGDIYSRKSLMFTVLEVFT